VKVIFAGGTPAALAAKRATATIPIVIGFVGDPVASGLVASLARPGGNVTGWTPEPGLELTAKRLEGLRDVVPGVTRVGLLWNPAKPIHESALKAVQAAARTLGIQLQPVGVRDAKELESQFQVVVTARTQALYVLPDGKFLSQRKRMMDLAIENRLPVAGGTREYAVAGALMAYAANLVDLHRRTAYFVDRILKGVKPADLPAERPTRFELVVNLKTAKALGLSIPQSLLLRADEVIQ
jgi:putative ABC transport system substrate-binding protein